MKDTETSYLGHPPGSGELSTNGGGSSTLTVGFGGGGWAAAAGGGPTVMITLACGE